MQSVERHGVVYERCEECGGVFLDRGELEVLVRAEGAYYRRRPSWDEDDDERFSDQRRKKRKLRHFLEEILDFD